MNKNAFPLAIHYYRQPTPLPDEWEGDFAHMRELGINMVQFRPQWRWHERVEGTYVWDDIDRLFDLAEQYDLGVVFKFMLETAPDWLYRDYPATRITPEGTKLVPRAMGAFYVGGWMPCFDAPEVRERAARFVTTAVERYRDRPALVWWHAWNEPRSRPMGECACPASIAGYREYMKRRFDTVEALNDWAGKCWASFEDITPPVAPDEYTEMFLWRHWAAESVVERVRMVVDAIRSVDSDHPVMAHVGCCSPIQNVLCDTSDDRLVAPEVDLYGSSFGPELDGGMGHDAAALNCDWIRAVGRGRKWWINEAYIDPCVGFRRECGADHVRHSILTPIAHGASGVMMWQYRAERYAMESDDNGIVTSVGEDTPRSDEVARLGKFLDTYGHLFVGAQVPRSRIALMYDFRSDLISAMEGACFDKSVVLEHPYSLRVLYAYKRALQGAYSMFFTAGHHVEWVDARDAERLSDGFALAYLPLPFVVGDEYVGHLLRFAGSGGMLVAEAGFGLRVENAWMNVHSPGLPELGYRLKRHLRFPGIRLEADVSVVGGMTVSAEEYFDVLEPAGGGTVRAAGSWRGDLPKEIPADVPAAVECAVGTGRVLSLAFSPGVTNYWKKDGGFAAALANEAGVEPLVKLKGADAQHVAARMLEASDGKSVLFLRNTGTVEARISRSCLRGLDRDIWKGTRMAGDDVVIPPGEFGVFLDG